MKRLSFALAALGLTAGAYAALPAATDPTVISVPQLPGGFVIGGSGFYLQPINSNGDLDYATVNTATSASNSSFFAASLKNVDPGYDWGWGVNVGYIFPNTGNDINLSYLQLDTSDSSSSARNDLGISPIANNFNFPVDDVFPFGFEFANSSATAKAEYDLNQVDLTAGQYINVGCRLTLHPFAGLRWAQLERKLNTNYSQIAINTFVEEAINFTQTFSQNISFNEKSDFSGIGPIAGLDASYYVGMGFGVVGHFDSALLIGNIDASTNEFVQQTVSSINNSGNFSFTTGVAASANFTASSTRRIVPVLDAKLGVDYTYVFNNSANSDLTLEAGWMVSNYFNAVDRLTTTTDIVPGAALKPPISPISGAAITGRTTSDFGQQGPYVSLVAHI